MTENNSKNNNWKESLKVETESNKSSTRKVEILFDPELFPESEGKGATRTYFVEVPLDEEKTLDPELYPELRHSGETMRTVPATPNNDAYTRWHKEWVKDKNSKGGYIPPDKEISEEIFYKEDR